MCWGLTSQSTIFQSCRDGAIASWVINQYFWGVKCLAQGHNTAEVGLEPGTSRSGVRHSTTEPPRSPLNLFEPVEMSNTILILFGQIYGRDILVHPYQYFDQNLSFTTHGQPWRLTTILIWPFIVACHQKCHERVTGPHSCFSLTDICWE